MAYSACQGDSKLEDTTEFQHVLQLAYFNFKVLQWFT